MKSVHKQGGTLEMVAIALPMVVSQGCDTVMIFTDRLFLSKLQPELMNAAMGGGLTVFMMMSFFLGLVGYGTALVAQYLGAGRKQDCGVVLTQAIIISCVAYPLILLCAPLAARMFTLMGVSPAQLGPQQQYFNILIYGSIFTLLRFSLGAFFSGIGRTGIVMAASFTAMIVNTILNYILIFGKFGVPALGITGSAYGTLVGSFSGVLVLVIGYLARKNRVEFSLERSFRFDPKVLWTFLRFGTSAGVEFVLNIIAFNAMIMAFHAHSLVTATAATIMFNWDLVSIVPLIGVEIGVTSMVGRHMGAGRPDLAHKSVISGFKLGAMYSAVIFILFIGFPSQIANIFHPSVPSEVFNQALPLAEFMLRVASIYVLVEAVFIVFIGALRGAGDTFWAMCSSVALHWVAAIGVMVSLRVLHLSPKVSWAFIVAVFALFPLILYARYRAGKWRTIKVVEPAIPAPSVDSLGTAAEL
jgi:multidrug resistance protein, MATE family